MRSFNPNKIDQNDKDWIEEISDNWRKYLSRWLLDYNNGICKLRSKNTLGILIILI